MKEFKEFINENNKKEIEAMRGWVYRQVEDSNKAHSDIKKEFIKKFGSKNVKYFEQFVSDIVD